MPIDIKDPEVQKRITTGGEHLIQESQSFTKSKEEAVLALVNATTCMANVIDMPVDALFRLIEGYYMAFALAKRDASSAGKA